MQRDVSADIASIQAIQAVPTILETVAAITGLRFVCIARVTEDSWTTCAVLDKLDFGLKVGDGLDVATTLCEEVRNTQQAVVIDHVALDPKYRDHQTPRIYGFQSYISVPLFRPDGDYFGTLCGLDPLPAHLTRTAVTASMSLFAQLISGQLESELALEETRQALSSELETAELREQFIAVLGHDLRTPLSSILYGSQALLLKNLGPSEQTIVQRIKRSALRIAGLVDDVVDFTRGRMGGGIAVELRHDTSLQEVFEQVVAELRGSYPEREIIAGFDLNYGLRCDATRMAQLLSNLLKNALVHGAPQRPVTVSARPRDGGFELIVSNEGPAIPASTIEQLFKPFWRGATLTSASAGQQGLGLGLFIVSEIARSHGGKIDVVSNDDVTSFIFTMSGAALIGNSASVQA